MTAITAPSTTTRDSFLRFALRLDAVVSGVMGIVGLAIAPQIAELSGTTPSFEYAIGAFFVAYGAAVLILSSRPSVRLTGRACAIGNLVYSVATVIMVLADVFPLTATGIVATLGSGVFTLVMADLQYLGLRRIKR
jgi:glucose uptake protein GlcU